MYRGNAKQTCVHCIVKYPEVRPFSQWGSILSLVGKCNYLLFDGFAAMLLCCLCTSFTSKGPGELDLNDTMVSLTGCMSPLTPGASLIYVLCVNFHCRCGGRN